MKKIRNLRLAALTVLLMVITGILAACGTAGDGPDAAVPPAAPVATQGTTLGDHAPGPFDIKLVSCGRYTGTQQTQFGTNAVSGAVVRVTNSSNDLVGQPQVTVDFTLGSVIDTSNVSDPSDTIVPSLSPGQSELVSIDNLTGSGANGDVGDSCNAVKYIIMTSGSSDTVGPFVLKLVMPSAN